jgi:hypothetical protein
MNNTRRKFLSFLGIGGASAVALAGKPVPAVSTPAPILPVKTVIAQRPYLLCELVGLYARPRTDFTSTADSRATNNNGAPTP